MEKTLPKIEFTTAKGTVSAKVRSILKNKVVDKLEIMFPTGKMTEKGFAIEIGVDAYTKKPIYAILNPSITLETEPVKKASNPTADKAPSVPDIFE